MTDHSLHRGFRLRQVVDRFDTVAAEFFRKVLETIG
jgi:hypothetical protein